MLIWADYDMARVLSGIDPAPVELHLLGAGGFVTKSLYPYLLGLSEVLESIHPFPIRGGVAMMTGTWICAAAWLGINAALVGLRFRVTQQDS